MMEDELVDKTNLVSTEDPSKSDAAVDHKKNDGDLKDPASTNSPKTLEEKAKEFCIFIVSAAKKTDKRTMLLAKQRLEAKAKEFFRCVVGALEKAKPGMILAKQAFEKKVQLFVVSVLEMMKQVNIQNMLRSRDWLQLKSQQLVYTALKLVKETNYRSFLQKGYQSDVVKRHQKSGLSLLAVFMVVTVAFRGNDSLKDGLLMNEYSPNSVRGRSLSAREQMPLAMSFKPSEHSLHPKWALWRDMPSVQQKNALEELFPFFERYGYMIGSEWTKLHIDKELICDFVPDSPRDICGSLPKKPCSFLSIGVHGEAKFETNLAKNLECRGFVVDPNAVKPSKLLPAVSFQNFALTSIHKNDKESPNQLEDQRNSWNTSVPALSNFLKLDFTDILRLDCEGCEIAMMRDILVEDPAFFHKVGQVSVMKHASKTFVDTEEELYYFGLMFPLLEEAGFVLVSSRVVACKGDVENLNVGCRPEFHEWGYTCGFGRDDTQKLSRSCQDYLFVKEELAYRPTTLPKLQE
jgi:Methyltransferase domain